MTDPHKMLIAVDAEALSRLESKLDAILRLLESSQIQPAPDWVSISDAAAIKGCSAATIRRRIDRGEIEAIGAGKARRVKVR